MKRFPELRDLSDDHHHGLALSLRARKAASSESDQSVEQAWAEVEETFADELEPHFQIEEEALAPLMERHGDRDLIARLFEEHRVLRAFVAPGAERGVEPLAQFAELLRAHIRFEEELLFETAQQHLTAEELKEVEAKCQRRKENE